MENLGVIASTGYLRCESSDRSLPYVSMRVDEARDHQPAAGIDYLNAGCTRRQRRSDGGDDVVAYEDVAVGQIAELGIDRDDVAALDEEFSSHDVVAAFRR